MKEHDNDNDELSFITLGAATLNVVRYLDGPQDHERDRERQTPGERTEEEKAKDHAEAVKNGLRKIDRFERSYRRQDGGSR